MPTAELDALRHRGWIPPVWAWPLSLLASLAGVGVSVYLTVVHYNTHVTLACSSTGLINCERVTTSPQSEVSGIPVAVLGVVWFAVMLVMSTPWSWRAPGPAIWVARVAWTVGGVGMVLHLLYAELFQIDAICLWCTAVHALVLVLFAIVAFATSLARVAE